MLKRSVQWAEPVVSETRSMTVPSPARRTVVVDIPRQDLVFFPSSSLSIPSIGLCRHAAAGEECSGWACAIQLADGFAFGVEPTLTYPALRSV